MQWEWKAGPAFLVTLVLTLLTALGWFTDARSASQWTERIVRLETQMQTVLSTGARIENKVDTLRGNVR